MNRELDETLCKKYPLIFRDRNADMHITCMCWGFECGDGWYNIIDNLCAVIMGDFHNRTNKRRWYIKSNPLSPEPPEVTCSVATQVKEKYGGLRFYLYDSSEYVCGAVALAEALSEVTCELCGSPGTRNEGGWMSTRCDKCRNKS